MRQDARYLKVDSFDLGTFHRNARHQPGIRHSERNYRFLHSAGVDPAIGAPVATATVASTPAVQPELLRNWFSAS